MSYEKKSLVFRQDLVQIHHQIMMKWTVLKKTCIRKKLVCFYKKKKKSNWSHPIEWSRNICAIVAHSVSLKLLDYECMFQFDTFVLFIQYMVLLTNWDELRLIRRSCRFFLYWAWIKRFKTNLQLRNNLRHIFWSWKPKQNRKEVMISRSCSGNKCVCVS